MPNFSSCRLREVAGTCATSPAKVKQALVRAGLYEDSVEGSGPDAVITSKEACRAVLRQFVDEEDIPRRLADLNTNGDTPGPEPAAGAEASGEDRRFEDERFHRAERVSLVGIKRTPEEAVARAPRGGFAFLKSPELEEDCHFWIQSLDGTLKRFLHVEGKQVGRLPPVVPAIHFAVDDASSDSPTTEQLRTQPVWQRALVRIRQKEEKNASPEVEIPGEQGTAYLWHDGDTLEPGYCVARVWPAIPTDREVETNQQNALIVAPQESFSWDGEPIDNVEAVERDASFAAPLVESVADRLSGYLERGVEEDGPDEQPPLAGLQEVLDILAGQGAYFKRAVLERTLEEVQERERTLPLRSAQALLHVVEVPSSAARSLLVETLRGAVDQWIGARALDLETDGHEIWELGTASGMEAGRTLGPSEVEEGLKELRADAPPLWVGHNVRGWDRKALVRNGLSINKQRLWDTLRTEALLSPRRASLALDTTHRAGEDAAVSYRLFRNQVARLLIRAERGDPVASSTLSELLGHQEKNLAELQALPRQAAPLHEVAEDALREERDELLSDATRPAFLTELQERLDAYPEADTVHLVYPRPLQPLLARLEGVQFAGGAGAPHRRHVRAPRERDENSYTARLAGAYRRQCRQEGSAPTLAGLSPWARACIEENPTWIEPAPDEDHEPMRWAAPVEAYEIERPGAPDHLLVVAPTLIAAHSRKFLKEYEGSQLGDFITDHHLWAKLDGGNSFCRLTGAAANALTDLPAGDPFVEEGTLWLQRTPLRRYRVHAHQHRAARRIAARCPEDCSNDVFTLENEDEERTETESNMRCIKLDTGGRAVRLHEQRLSPTTRQRASYWAVQALLLRRLATRSARERPVVLLAREEDDDLGDLREFFRRQDWYVPRGGTLRRRLELIAENPGERRLAVVPMERWTALATQRIAVPVHLVIDALPIKEQQALRGGDVSKEDLKALPSEGGAMETAVGATSPEVGDEEAEGPEATEEADEEATKDRPYGLQRGLYLVAPILRWLSYTAHELHPDADLCVLDPRAEPIELPDGLSLRSTRVPTYGEETYERTLERAEQHLRSPVPPEEITLPENWRESLARIFLPEKEDGTPGAFYEEQEPYLEPIMERRRDVIVELPTGGGKSVLFQAPALYHGLRYDLLTIVVTPLKALMVDQARDLYDKGFLSSVDYVNSDLPQVEVHDIYRRLASGELSMLYLAPERFRSRSFLTALRTRLEADGMLCYVVFDEAHCVSLWGLDFRPDFQRPVDFVNEQRRSQSDVHPFPCVMLSATITEQIYEHLRQLFDDLPPASDGRDDADP